MRPLQNKLPGSDSSLRAVCLCSRLGRSDVLCLEAFGPLGDVKCDCLAFLQAAKATCLDSRKMHENIVARLATDEAEAFGVVKPFHCSLFHCVTCFYFEFLLRRIAAGDKGVALVGGTDFQLLGESNLADIYSMCEVRKTIHSE